MNLISIDRCQEKFKNSTDEDEKEIDEKLTQILARIKAKEELSRKCKLKTFLLGPLVIVLVSAGIKKMDDCQQKLNALQE